MCHSWCSSWNVCASCFKSKIGWSKLIIGIFWICNVLYWWLWLWLHVLMSHFACSLGLCNKRAVLTLLIFEEFSLNMSFFLFFRIFDIRTWSFNKASCHFWGFFIFFLLTLAWWLFIHKTQIVQRLVWFWIFVWRLLIICCFFKIIICTFAVGFMYFHFAFKFFFVWLIYWKIRTFIQRASNFQILNWILIKFKLRCGRSRNNNILLRVDFLWFVLIFLNVKILWHTTSPFMLFDLSIKMNLARFLLNLWGSFSYFSTLFAYRHLLVLHRNFWPLLCFSFIWIQIFWAQIKVNVLFQNCDWVRLIL